MAKYNTFVVCNCKSGKVLMVTSSAIKARRELTVGKRVEVWNENIKAKSVTWVNRDTFSKYVQDEKAYISNKQTAAEARNAFRKAMRY